MVTSFGTENSPGSLNISSDVVFGKEDYKKIVSLNNQLGLDLLSVVEADINGNTFISPTSLYMALSMVYNGADGVTKTEISKVLKTEKINLSELNNSNVSLMAMLLQRNSNKIQLNIANSIWLNDDYHFRKEFAQTNKDYFNAKIQGIDVHDSQSPKIINDWVKKSTNNKIKEIADDPLDTDLVAMLINTIYFKGEWKQEFDKKKTENQTFYLEDGTTKDVPLMTLKGKLAYMENENFQAVSLPYGDEQMSMKVFLPKENSSLGEFKKMLTNDNWKKWNAEFSSKEGTVLLPKFQLEYEVLLNESLKKLGMTTAFDHANFKKMIKENVPLYISKVKQKTFIDVNEKGSEAAAATSVEISKESAIKDEFFHMIVNRPFFITITDDETGTILFIGSVTNPMVGK